MLCNESLHCTLINDLMYKRNWKGLFVYYTFHSSITSVEADVMRSLRSVCHSLWMSVILSVCTITANIINRFRWNFLLYWAYQSEVMVDFCWWSGPGYGFQITVLVPHQCGMVDFRRFISISHTVTGRFSLHTNQIIFIGSAKWLMPTR